VWRGRGILGLLVRRDLAVKYQSSVLGYLWSLIEPLTIAGIYWFIFGVLYNQRAGDDNVPYVLFLASGLFAWIWINGVLSDATTAMTLQSRLITTIRTPREIFAIARVFGKFIEYAAALPVLLLIAVALHGRFTWHLLYIVPAILVEFVFLIGIALMLSAFNVLLRDTEKFVRLLQRLLFYALPVIYPISRVLHPAHARIPGWVQDAYQCNPLVGIMELHHAVWYDVPPAPLAVWAAVVGSMVILVLGWVIFRALESAVLKEL
jgi:ABC-2 type transport system permease protein